MLSDYILKIVNEHPLVTYIEDPIRAGDVEGWKLFTTMLKAKFSEVKIGVNKWFKSDIATIKQFTQMITIADEEEEELEEGEEFPVDPNTLKILPDFIHLSK